MLNKYWSIVQFAIKCYTDVVNLHVYQTYIILHELSSVINIYETN